MRRIQKENKRERKKTNCCFHVEISGWMCWRTGTESHAECVYADEHSDVRQEAERWTETDFQQIVKLKTSWGTERKRESK